MNKHLSPALASLPLLAVLCALTGEPISSARADTLYGLTTSRQLARIDTEHPGRASAVTIEGVASGERLLTMAYAPPAPGSWAGALDGGLFAVGSKGTVYAVSVEAARATALGQLSADVASTLSSGSFALVWSGGALQGPASSSFALLGSKGLNLSLTVGADGISQTKNSALTGEALGLSSASRVAGTTYALNTKTASLLEVPSSGPAVVMAPLEVDTFGVSGLALTSDGRGWAALLADTGVSTLYEVTLAGAPLRALGELSLADGTPLAPIAALTEVFSAPIPAPSPVPEPSAPALAIAGVGAAWFLGRRRSRQSSGLR